jgi:hypothetical protein
MPGPEQLINALCQLTPCEFDSLLLFLGIQKADVGGEDLRWRAVSVYQRVARPGRNRERNLLRLKSEIERRPLTTTSESTVRGAPRSGFITRPAAVWMQLDGQLHQVGEAEKA